MHARSPARRLAAIGAALALAAAGGCGEGDSAGSPPTSDELYALSVLPQEIGAVRENVREGLSLRRTRFSDAQYAIALRIADDHFAVSALETRIRARLAREADSEHLAPVVEWLRSPLGRRLVEAVNRAHSPDSDDEMTAFITEKHASPLSPVRVELAERYNAATGSVEVTAKLLLLAGYFGNMMLNVLATDSERLAREELSSIMDSQYELLHPMFVEIANIKTQMMLDRFTDAEVTSLVLFAESDEGQWFHRVSNAALLESIEETAVEAEREFLAALDSDESD